MSKMKIELSPRAVEDLNSIREYISENWGKQTANKIIKQIVLGIRRLETYPLLGISLSKKLKIPTDYYYIILEKNYVFYRLKSEEIQIVRIISEKQNFIRQLFPKDGNSKEV